MRIVWLLAFACSSPPRPPQPKPLPPLSLRVHECPGAEFPDTTGWCRQSSRARPPGTWLAVSADLRTIERLRGDPTQFMRTATLDRVNGVHVSSSSLTPRIHDNRLQLRTRPTSCHERAYGCFQGCSSDPGETVFEDPAPPHGCIAASLDLPGGLIVSVGNQLRAYASTERGITPRASLDPSRLTAITRLFDAVLLQDRTGVLWIATWEADDEPQLEALSRESEILAVSPVSNNVFYAIATDALLAIDSITLVTRWRFAGEVWSQTYDWEAKRHYVLSIVRSPTPRAIVYVLDDNGDVESSRVVYAGADLVEAHLTLGMKGVLVEITR